MDDSQMQEAEAALLNAARVYGVQAKREELKDALASAGRGSELAKWAKMYLGRDTLLTTSELHQYKALDKSGRVDKLAGLYDLAEVAAVDENSLREAIDELKRSTDNISKQTETLRNQQDALSRLVKRQSESASHREALERERGRKIELERSQLVREVEKLSRELGFRLDDIEQHGPAAAEEIDLALKADDKLLSSLQKLGCELDQPDPGQTKATDTLRETCMRLIKTVVESVRTKLDAVYLDTLVTAERSGSTDPASNEEVQALQEEVESLYSEILSVAQMSVEQQYLEPALESITAKSGQSLGKTAAALKYVNECMDHLLDRVGRLHAQIVSHKSYEAAAAELLAIAKAEMAVDVTVPTKLNATVLNESPVRQRKGRTAGSREDPPLETLLRSLGVSLPAPDGEGNGRTRVDLLAKTLRERSNKSSDLSKAAQESFERNARLHLDDATLATQLLKDSLLAESPFDEVKLIDPDIEGSIQVLTEEVDRAKDKLQSLEGQSVAAGSEKRDEFMQRWGS